MAFIVTEPSGNQPITDIDRLMVQEFRDFTQDVALAIRNLQSLMTQTGTGNPEGAVAATVGVFYIDTSALPGSKLYVKEVDSVSGDETLGWSLT